MFSMRIAIVAMATIVILSNYLVMFPINDWLTWGAFPYPISYLITELTNRFYGPKKARTVAYVGFLLAALLSVWLSTPKIALASASAFLLSQLLDIAVFSRLRRATWWYAPLVASFAASVFDASVFWSIAFLGEDVPLLTWALGDTAVKLLIDVAMLTPFRFAIKRFSNPQSFRA